MTQYKSRLRVWLPRDTKMRHIYKEMLNQRGIYKPEDIIEPVVLSSNGGAIDQVDADWVFNSGKPILPTRASGWYKVRFSWTKDAPEPCYWDGNEWLRPGIECGWNEDVIEVYDAI